MAELVAACASNPSVAENKCLEVVAEVGVVADDLDALLEAVPSEISRVRGGRGSVGGARGGGSGAHGWGGV